MKSTPFEKVLAISGRRRGTWFSRQRLPSGVRPQAVGFLMWAWTREAWVGSTDLVMTAREASERDDGGSDAEVYGLIVACTHLAIQANLLRHPEFAGRTWQAMAGVLEARSGRKHLSGLGREGARLFRELIPRALQRATPAVAEQLVADDFGHPTIDSLAHRALSYRIALESEDPRLHAGDQFALYCNAPRSEQLTKIGADYFGNYLEGAASRLGGIQLAEIR